MRNIKNKIRVNIDILIDNLYNDTRPSISDNLWRNITNINNIRVDIWIPITNNLQYAKFK